MGFTSKLEKITVIFLVFLTFKGSPKTLDPEY